jgi:hypothetical protein
MRALQPPSTLSVRQSLPTSTAALVRCPVFLELRLEPLEHVKAPEGEPANPSEGPVLVEFS